MVRVAFIFACIWCVVALLYLFAGLLIVLHSEDSVVELIKAAGKLEVISSIAAIFSAVAAFMSWRAADKSAEAQIKANVNASLPHKLRARDALSAIFAFLSRKICALSLDMTNPSVFMITREEIEFLNGLRDPIFLCSSAYGPDLHERITGFYIELISELEAQIQLADYDPGGEAGLNSQTQGEYLKFRKKKEVQVFGLLQEVTSALYL